MHDIADRRVRGRALPVDLFHRVLAKFMTMAQDERTVELVGVYLCCN